MKARRKKIHLHDLLMDSVIYLILGALVIVTFYPIWHVIVASFSTSIDIVKHPGLILWPEHFTAGAYRKVFEHPLLMKAFGNSVKILALSLPINIVMTLLCGYFMSCTNMLWKRPIVAMIMFTMFFSGGLIPNFLNIRSLGLYNTIWALVLPSALSVHNSLICKTAIEGIPDSLKESAFIDGASDFQVLWRVIVPLMKPTLAVLLLYYGVGKWNAWFAASIYIKDNAKMPIQNILRAILLENNSMLNQVADSGDQFSQYTEAIKYAAVVVSTLPIMCIYPFLQKYFTKGVMIGAVKG